MTVSILVDTAGSAEANVYAAIAFADQYFADRLNCVEWTNAIADDKSRALLQATREIDAMTFIGDKYNPYFNTDGTPQQALEFPRIINTGGGYDLAERLMFYSSSASIPLEIKQANCEQALFLLRKAAQSQDASDGGDVQSFSRGGVSVSLRQSGPQDERRALSTNAISLLSPFLQKSYGVKLVR